MDNNQEIKFNEEQMGAAAAQEENERLQAQLEYLTNRIVLLRALANSQAEELETLRPKSDTEPGEGIETAGPEES